MTKLKEQNQMLLPRHMFFAYTLPMQSKVSVL